jgi:hypothetical protein
MKAVIDDAGLAQHWGMAGAAGQHGQQAESNAPSHSAAPHPWCDRVSEIRFEIVSSTPSSAPRDREPVIREGEILVTSGGAVRLREPLIDE